MVTPEQLTRYLANVPALPESVRATIDALNEGELSEAAKAASGDKALLFYLQSVVNSAAFGFKSRLKDPGQIFSALGVQRAKQLLYAYMVSLLAPKKWGFFDMDTTTFTHFQSTLMAHWQKIVASRKADERYLSAAAIMSAGLVVADAIFAEHRQNVELLMANEALDLGTILQRVSGMPFESLVLKIAEKWEVDEAVRRVVQLAFGKKACDIAQIECELAKFLHLLFFYELSRPAMMEAGANALIEFHPEFVTEVMDAFNEIVGVS
jgi:HD-like signal output (HDOD) protein